MNLASLIGMFQAVLTKKDIQANSGENTNDVANNQMVCTGDICACTWKPYQNEASSLESGSQTSN